MTLIGLFCLSRPSNKVEIHLNTVTFWTQWLDRCLRLHLKLKVVSFTLVNQQYSWESCVSASNTSCDYFPPWVDFTSANSRSADGWNTRREMWGMKLVWEWMEIYIKKKKKELAGRKPAKRPFLEQIEMGKWESEIKDGLAERDCRGRREGVREMRSERSRWWRGASRDQNLPKNFKGNHWSTITSPVLFCTLRTSYSLNPPSDTFRLAEKQAQERRKI